MSHNFFTHHIVFSDFVIQCSFLSKWNCIPKSENFIEGLKMLKQMHFKYQMMEGR